MNAGGDYVARTWLRYFSGTGRVYQKEYWLDGGTNPVVTYGYHNPYGTLKSTKDARGGSTTISYDTTWTYPETVTDALGHTVTTYHDHRYGKPTTAIDANGQTTEYEYDELGRLTRMTDPLDITSPHGTVTYDYKDNLLGSVGEQRVVTRATVKNGTDVTTWKSTYFDGLGRTIQERKEGPEGKAIAADTRYTPMGQVKSKSVPYFTVLPLDQRLWVEHTYDAMGRQIETKSPDGATTKADYDRGRTILLDANGHQKVETRDAHGRLARVTEYTGGPGAYTVYATTTYGYDTLGNLIEVKDAATPTPNTTTIKYDTLSRKTWMRDPDVGIWSYGYDPNGNLDTQTDAHGNATVHTHDALRRVELTTSNGQVVADYRYDEATSTYAVGRPTRVDYPSGRTVYNYDKRGRGTVTVKWVDDDGDGALEDVEKRQATFTYNGLDRTTKINYPDNTFAEYSYDAGTYLRGTAGATFSGYNALGQVGKIAYPSSNGKHVETLHAYHPKNNRLTTLKTLVVDANGVTLDRLQDYEYGYDSVGNITSITDRVSSSRTVTYKYDELNRLREAASPGYGAQSPITYTYDKIGNMTYNKRVGSYQYDPDHPHAVIRAGSNVYEYDECGNMTKRPGATLTYDSMNRLAAITKGGVTTTFSHDHAGERIKKATSTSPTTQIATSYIGDLFECTAGACSRHIFAGSKRHATIKPGETAYYHADHLGGLNVATSSNVATVQKDLYYPYGEKLTHGGTANLPFKFTGQEEDPESGLYYYGARYYDPVIGRFISPDSIVQNPGDPQALNRYSYCRNNPLYYVDPDGHFFVELLIGAIIGAALGATTSAITGGDIGLGALTGAITGGFLGGAGSIVKTLELTGVVAAGAYAAAGASAGAINAGISGSDIGIGALSGGAFAAAAYAFPNPNFKLFGQSPVGSIANRMLNSSLTGAAFGAVSAGMTGGDILHGMGMGAAGWAAGEAGGMLIGHAVGFARSGEGPTFDPKNGTFVYNAKSGGAVTFSNVISGPNSFLKGPFANYDGTVTDQSHTTYEHEVGHTPQGTLLGPAYVPSQALSLTVGGFTGVFGGYGFMEGTHLFNLLERQLHPVPYPVGP